MKDHRNIAEYALRVVVMINENAIMDLERIW